MPCVLEAGQVLAPQILEDERQDASVRGVAVLGDRARAKASMTLSHRTGSWPVVRTPDNGGLRCAPDAIP